MFNKILLLIVNFRWKKNNQKNNIKLKSVIPLEMLDVGKATYGNLNIKVYDKKAKIKIGNYCSIADNVVFLVGGEHDYKRISTFPFQSLIYKQKTKKNEKNDIVVDDDVWIGYESLILSGSHIGKGSVIGARSVVKGEIPPYSVYVGNKIIKKRFSDEIINKLNDIDYSKIDHVFGDEYSIICQEDITEDNVDNIIKKFINK